jgi:poly-gamma-glutamate synthesis protein (capsule biosynthesis protein)
VGAGLTAEQATRPLVLSIRGTTVGMLAFTSFVNRPAIGEAFVARARDAVAATRALRPQVDLLLVSMHWGREWLRDADGDQVALGHALVDAGADAVLGHHSHCIQPVEVYKGKPIVYSMGNFIWGRQSSPTDLTFAAELELSKTAPSVRRVRLHGLVLHPPMGLARPVSGAQARFVYGALIGPSLRFRTRMTERDGALEVALPAAAAAASASP